KRRSGSRYSARMRMGRASPLSRNAWFKYANGCCDIYGHFTITRRPEPGGAAALMKVFAAGLALVTLATFGSTAAQPVPSTPSIHARTARRLVIRNAMVIYGNAKPPYGPVDIVVQDGLISSINGSSDSPPVAAASDAVIDATGKYVMPGIVNAHM